LHIGLNLPPKDNLQKDKSSAPKVSLFGDGYYLLHHVIYCSYYLRVVTNKGWCLLHLA